MTKTEPINHKKCSAAGCERNAVSNFNGKPYCNKHWLRLYLYGTTRKIGKRVKTTFIKGDDYSTGITSKGTKFIFSNEDWARVTQHSWCTSKSGYLVCTINRKLVRLHRFILNVSSPKKVVDHINGDILDNRRKNLRITVQKNNSRNLKRQKNKTGYTGIRTNSAGNFAVRIMVNRNEIYLGTFGKLEDAINCRLKAEKKYFGKFARKIEYR